MTCAVCKSETTCTPECTRERDKAQVNANGCYINESAGNFVLALLALKYPASKFEAITAHMGHIQRTIGDVWGILKIGLFTPSDAPDAQVRFKFCGCLVVEDNTLPNDTVEFRDADGCVLARIVNLYAKMPREFQ